MADRPPDLDSNADASNAIVEAPDPGSSRSMPGWVKVPGIILGVLILAYVVLQVAGGGHGPQRHGGDTPSGEEAPAGGLDDVDPEHLEGLLGDLEGVDPEDLEAFFEDLHQ